MGGLGVVTFYSEIPDFEGAPGPTIPPKNTPREYVEEFLDENLLQLIVIETNWYALQWQQWLQQRRISDAITA